MTSFFRDKSVALKEAAFEPSSPLRHALELSKCLKAASVNTILKPLLALYIDGGPDHRLTYGAVQVALIAMFKHLQLDYIVAARACPGQLFKNPVAGANHVFDKSCLAVYWPDAGRDVSRHGGRDAKGQKHN